VITLHPAAAAARFANPPETAPFALFLVGYTADKTRAALRFCDHAFRGFDIAHRVLVDNRPQELRALRDEWQRRGWQIVEGSNTLHEFSGWQEGLDALAMRNTRPLHTLFLNDTVVSHRFFSAWRLLALRIALATMDADCERLVGFTHPANLANGVHSIDGREFERWVSTYCFALSARALDRLDRRILDTEAAERYVPGGEVEERFLSDALSHALHLHYRWWLFRSSVRSSGWYRSEPLNAATSARLVNKARCMLLEQLLSLRCEDLGIEVVDPFDRHPAFEFLDRVDRNVIRVARSLTAPGQRP
jgi:hypothetical protein